MNSLPSHFGKHFFGCTNPATPKEILSLVTAHVPPRDKPNVGLVNKDWHEVYIDDPFWQNAGAKNYTDFVDRMNALPDDDLKNLVCNQVYNLTFAEEIQQLFLMSFEEKKAYFSEIFPGFGVGLTDRRLQRLLTDYGVQALMENLITPEQAASMTEPQSMMLLRYSGLQALRENLITFEQATGMHYEPLACLLKVNGVQALRENLITPEQANAMTGKQLNDLLNDNGLQALRENLITPEQAAGMDDNKLVYLLHDKGLLALRQKWITPEEASGMHVFQLIDLIGIY